MQKHLGENVQRKGYMNIESMKIDIDRQMKNIAKRIVNTKKSLIGWRSPDLKVLGDDQFGLFENKSIYDASLVLDRSIKDIEKCPLRSLVD
jgi:hypothetical protein